MAGTARYRLPTRAHLAWTAFSDWESIMDSMAVKSICKWNGQLGPKFKNIKNLEFLENKLWFKTSKF